ncbi:MAG: imidazole glycerol phosphate synthase subunit HisH [Rhodocyclaceae bacterium]|nr:imidazole glycerol phosphate synthase subunit HisH [Rhodocyclaceae bacterium]MBX3669316.1 imidazole glycerol phosphate synthase subunit HisH [Rhodocyclaceae bacterium]
MGIVAIVDYGMGNLRSVAKAVEHVAPHAQVLITSSAAEVARAERVIFPGQGAMPDCMRELAARGLAEAVVAAAREKPFLGICIGLQMLFRHSAEGDVPGLGVLAGEVVRFPAQMQDAGGARLKVPHMGWNCVNQARPHALWAGIPPAARFYFVHSYFVQPEQQEVIAASAEYGIPFTCAVASDNIFAVQFHPEKSAQHGLALLGNFLNWNP